MSSRCYMNVLAAAVLSTTGSVAVAQPVNDSCNSASAANVGQNFGSLTNATNDGACSCDGGLGYDVYFRFVPPATGNYGFSLCQDIVFFDSVLSIHTACPANDANELVCDDDGCGITGDLSALASVNLQAGTEYIIRVATYSDFDFGDTFVLNISGVTSGACCQASAGCTVTTMSGCTTLGGVFQGDNSVCLPSPCPVIGACCDVGGCCTPTAQPNCTGVWTAGVACSASPCPPPANDTCAGAITLPLGTPTMGFNCSATDDRTVSCAFSSPANTHRTVWYRFVPTHTAAYTFDTCGTAFDSLLAVFSGSCASPTQIACNDDSDSTGNTPCPTNNLASRIASITLTQGQTYFVLVATWGQDTPGGPYTVTANAVSALGKCCIGAACTLTDEARCAGTFTPSAACGPDACSSGQTGACCFGSTCSITTAAACTGLNKAFAGVGTVCNTFSAANAQQNRSPCCLANFNHSANPVEPTVQDVFDFLTAFFSNDPSANINGTQNATEPTVQDVFDFLTVFFAGC